MRFSLRLRVAISYAVLVILVIGGMSLYLWSFIRDSYLENSRNALLAECRVIAQEASINLAGGSAGEILPGLVARFASALNARVTFILPSGQVVGDSQADPVTIENHLNRPEVSAALSGLEQTSTRFSDTLKQDMVYAAVPIRVNNQVAAAARLAIPLTEVEAAMQSFGQRILFSAIIFTLLAILLAYFLTRYATDPLRRLTQRVLQMGGQLSAPRPVSDRVDETVQLEQAFDHLETELNSQIKALTNERGLLSTVMESMTDGVVIVNAAGNVELLNPAASRLFSISDEANGQSLIEVFRHHQLVEIWNKCLESGDQQITMFETSPNRLYIQAIAVPLPQSLLGSTLLVLQDLTRMRRLEMIRRDFVSNVSHELRTPLASLKALTETLQEGALEDPPAARRFLLRMENEIDNLTQLVTELLELSRIESGKVPLKMRLVQPGELISRVYERMQIQAERAELKISMEFAPQLPDINVDLNRMEQVMVNLVHNAIKFTPAQGEISISASPGDGSVIFTVRDTGVGISPDALPRIFERFYKADRSRSGGGTGLGLSIARHLVEAHGGKIWAESKVGQGSAFYFSIPAATS